jgi:hypothetical protein
VFKSLQWDSHKIEQKKYTLNHHLCLPEQWIRIEVGHMWPMDKENVAEVVAVFIYLNTTSIYGWSQWPCGLGHGSVATQLLGLWVWILPGTWMAVPCDCWMLPGGGLCVELTTRPEESYQVWCICLSVIMKPQEWGSSGPLGLLCHEKKNSVYETDFDNKASCEVQSFHCFCLWHIQLDMKNSIGSSFKFGSAHIFTP